MMNGARRWAVALTLVAFAAGWSLISSAGSAARASTSLVRGWNNVAYMGDAKPPTEALASLGSTYRSVYRWNPAAGKFDVFAPDAPAYVNTLTELRPGDAIWLDLNAESGSLPNLAMATPAGSGGKIAIPANAFVPANDLAIYEKSFNEIRPVGVDDASKRYYAPVVLPEGARVSTMTAAFEATGADVQVRLDYTPLANGSSAAQIYKLVEVLSSAGASPQTATAFSHTVDNGANVYFLVVDLTGPGAKLRGISITYGY